MVNGTETGKIILADYMSNKEENFMKGEANVCGNDGIEQGNSMTEPDKTRHRSGLNQKQFNAIDAILSGATDQEAADYCGVSRQT